MTDPTPGATACPSCHASLTPGARYCHRCGRAVGAGSDRGIWIAAWAVVAIAIASIVYFVNRAPAPATGPDMANAGNAGPATAAGARPQGAPPDISQMTPRERFLRLHDRIMSAQESGDTATAQRFAPMAISAYGMLDQVDVDARYHAGAIYILTRAYPEALALADTIQAESSKNLLGDLLRLEVAQAKKDAALEARARKAFLDNFDAQIARQRPEYQEHKAMLDDLRRQLSAP
ncbi:MAG TPA: zinc ribbon domain-containing protein [Gemmatimonadales bacterium]|nr:zinc ribbon domain-containing protein [Gemmatimonadales bacterium]